MLGQPAQAFPEQNHEAHVQAHQGLFMTAVVQQNPQIQSLIISHVMQHLQFLSAQVAQQQMPPEMAQRIQQMQMVAQQVPPQQAMLIQQELEMMMDSISSPILAQLTSDFLSTIQTGGEDPLVAIRQQELQLRDKEIDLDQEKFMRKQAQQQESKMMDNNIARQRLDIQKSIADDKLQLGLDRMRQQAELKLLELERQFRRN